MEQLVEQQPKEKSFWCAFWTPGARVRTKGRARTLHTKRSVRIFELILCSVYFKKVTQKNRLPKRSFPKELSNLQGCHTQTQEMRLVALVFGATLVVCGSAHPQSSGPVLEASGWTPVRSSQVPLRLPQEYLEQQQQQQQQQRGPEDLGQPARGEQDRQVIAYAPEDAGDYAVPPQEGPQDISVTVENQQDVRDVHTVRSRWPKFCPLPACLASP